MPETQVRRVRKEGWENCAGICDFGLCERGSDLVDEVGEAEGTWPFV